MYLLFGLLWSQFLATASATEQCASHTQYKRLDADDQLLFFTHIPKDGGRAVSYWLDSSYGHKYGADSSFYQSRPASIMLPAKDNAPKVAKRDNGKSCDMRKSHDWGKVRLAFSHDRPDIAFEKLINNNKGPDGAPLPQPNFQLVTFLRDVHSQRDSMVNKYITSRLREELKKKGRKVTKPTFKDWVYLDNPNKPWEGQTYSKPTLNSPQKIGVRNLDLTGGRNYQLMWVARGRNELKAECGSNKQYAVQNCEDDKLLLQAKNAVLEVSYRRCMPAHI
jgi:hypothetical protein